MNLKNWLWEWKMSKIKNEMINNIYRMKDKYWIKNEFKEWHIHMIKRLYQYNEDDFRF